MLECGFLVSAGALIFRLMYMAFSEARQGFSPGTPVCSPSSLVNVSANKTKLK